MVYYINSIKLKELFLNLNVKKHVIFFSFLHFNYNELSQSKGVPNQKSKNVIKLSLIS